MTILLIQVVIVNVLRPIEKPNQRSEIQLINECKWQFRYKNKRINNKKKMTPFHSRLFYGITRQAI